MKTFTTVLNVPLFTSQHSSKLLSICTEKTLKTLLFRPLDNDRFRSLKKRSTVMKKPVSTTLIMEYSEVNDKRRVNEVLHDFDQFLYKAGIEYDGQLTTCYRWYHASFFDFIASKEEVAEELVDLRKAAERVANKMWTDLMSDAPISKLIQE